MSNRVFGSVADLFKGPVEGTSSRPQPFVEAVQGFAYIYIQNVLPTVSSTVFFFPSYKPTAETLNAPASCLSLS